jgi:hypothetical protein
LINIYIENNGKIIDLLKIKFVHHRLPKLKNIVVFVFINVSNLQRVNKGKNITFKEYLNSVNSTLYQPSLAVTLAIAPKKGN